MKNAFELALQNEKVLLLLGAIYADEANAEKARRLAERVGKSSLKKRLRQLYLGNVGGF
ncbi:MAG: hypothetical protein WKF73_16515 [Nocardioidaceae bacterium]